MPDSGVPTPRSVRPASHTSTQEWRSFEVRMRRRRFERCVLRAEVALEAGFPDDARAALEEARHLDADAPEIAEVEALLAAQAASTPPSEVASRRYGRYVAIAAAAILASAGVGWSIQGYLARSFNTPGVAAGTPMAGPALTTAATTAPNKTAPTSSRPAQDGPRVQIRTEQIVVGTVGFLESERNGPDTRLAVAEPVVPAITPPSQDAPAAGMLPYTPPVQPAARTISPPVEPVTNIPEEAPRPPELPVSTPNAASLPVANTAVPAPPPIDERARVRSVLSRYEAAYSNLDAQAAQAVWPAVDRNALARAFSTLNSQRLSLGRCDVNLSGAIARANCSGSATWTPKVGSGRTEARRWDFTLQNSDGTWKIVAAQAR